MWVMQDPSDGPCSSCFAVSGNPHFSARWTAADDERCSQCVYVLLNPADEPCNECFGLSGTPRFRSVQGEGALSGGTCTVPPGAAQPGDAQPAAVKQGGVKHDLGKLRLDLIPPESVTALGGVLTYGAAKYGDRNWEAGLTYGRVYAACQRHLWAWFGGEDVDSESGLSHLDHALACLAFLATYERRGRRDLDDRRR